MSRATDPALDRLRRVPENAALCAFVERDQPQVHTDLVDELDRAAEGLSDVHVWCPEPARFSFYALHRESDIVFAFAAGMQSISLRIPPERLREALADGGAPWLHGGPGWVSFSVFDGKVPIEITRGLLRRWCAAAHAASCRRAPWPS